MLLDVLESFGVIMNTLNTYYGDTTRKFTTDNEPSAELQLITQQTCDSNVEARQRNPDRKLDYDKASTAAASRTRRGDETFTEDLPPCPAQCIDGPFYDRIYTMYMSH